MSCFKSKSSESGAAPVDLSKHVNYTLGMVLGVDDFTQEFAYLSGRDQWLARDLIGYGTVCGLKVDGEPDDKGPRIAVSPGVALNPRGQQIKIDAAQCCYLNDWLVAHQEKVKKHLTSPTDNVLRLYLVLCYRECKTDSAPIPGEPCRTAEESMAYSRIKDDYTLELCWEPPDQSEETAVRDFIRLLRQIEISEASGDLTLDEFIQFIRDHSGFASSPPGSPPTSPPMTLHIHPDNVCDYLRAGFRFWTTQFRPLTKGISEACTGIPAEECVLLAQIEVPVKESGPWVFDSARKVVVDESQRPYLIHLRMLQEWLLCGWHAMTSQAIKPADSVISETSFGQFPDSGSRAEYSRADHSHGTPPDPIPAHQADANAHLLAGEVIGGIGDTRVASIQSVPVLEPGSPPAPVAEDDVLTIKGGIWQAAPPHDPIPAHQADVNAHNLQGEVTGAIGATRVSKIQSIPVSPIAPASVNDGQVLMMMGRTWQATPLPTIGGNFVDFLPVISNFTIVAAGIVRGDGSFRSPVYNNLRATALPNSEVQVTFDNYTIPNGDNFQYIIKVLPIVNEQIRTPIVSFSRFEQDGFILQATTGSRPLSQEDLLSLELMIEVSFFIS